MSTQTKNIFLLSLITFLWVVFFFTPIFGHEFAYHNDYRIWEYNNHDCCTGYPESTHLIGVGRYIQAILLNIQLMTINSMFTLWLNQIFSVISIAILAVISFLFFRKALDITPTAASLLSILMVTLPSMTINSFWVTNYIPEIATLFIVFLAQALVLKGSRYYWIAFIIILVALFNYPPAALFFVTITFIKFLYGPAKPHQAELINLGSELLLIILACLIFFLSVKFVIKPFLLAKDFNKWSAYYGIINNNMLAYKFEIGLNFAGKWLQFKDYVRFVFSAWFPLLTWPILSFVIVCFFVSLVGSTLYNPYLKSLSIYKKIVIGTFFSVALMLFTALPVLAGPATYAVNYRVSFATMAIIPAMLVFLIDRLALRASANITVLPILISGIIFIFFAECISLHRIILVVERSAYEYQKIKNTLSAKLTDQIKEIRIQLPITPDVDGKFLYADFALNGTDVRIAGQVNVALSEVGKNPNNYSIIYGYHFDDDYTGKSLLVSNNLPIRNISEQLISGKWFSSARPAKIILTKNKIIIQNEGGAVSRGIIENSKYLNAIDWNTKATLSLDGRELRWNNSSLWLR